MSSAQSEEDVIVCTGQVDWMSMMQEINNKNNYRFEQGQRMG